jgi:hypothetical protein
MSMTQPTQKEVALITRHQALSHAMQSGVAVDMEQKPEHPKHFRVGINVALVDHASLVKLLCDKGLITYEEYLTAIVDGMEREVKRYEDLLSARLGTRVTLG